MAGWLEGWHNVVAQDTADGIRHIYFFRLVANFAKICVETTFVISNIRKCKLQHSYRFLRKVRF